MIIEHSNIFRYRNMTVTDTKIHECCWEDYLRLPGISFSGLKENREFSDGVIAGMRIGTLVHRYILKPSEYNQEDAEIVRPIANALIKFVGHTLLRLMICEKGVTAKFIVDQFYFLWRGMPDMFLIGHMIIDFKIIKSGTLQGYVERLGYKNQLRGYMLGLKCSQGLIIAYNRAKKSIEYYMVTLDDISFWSDIVLTRGYVIKNVS